ncbi:MULTISPECIES: GTP pyrophosphokinase [Clostridium]|uniref:RelA/SpoT domain-containing protein n=1 Tax=Clostridium frigoriphilum TaxID=443253 RepID=A0ABU7UTJ1_9CLOT|nr:hypothetical protein [Clostridium sp. DSM 17811]MBU3101928.1 hypothetical protein [Clostridium sp. DSM 17811]
MEKLATAKFDFKLHQQNAIDEFTKFRPLHEAFSITIQTILKKCLDDKNIKYHSIEARAKSINSFAEKASKPSKNNINLPKYKNPIEEITDLTGVRIITFFPITINAVNQVLSNEFTILEKNDKSAALDKQEKLGYKSVHYLIKLKPSRCNLSEYKLFTDMVAEVQVRTILQHAWAEIEHDIEYKSETIIPIDIKRRFMALAGLLEIADREFQSIQNDDVMLKKQSRISVNSGKLQNIEITNDSVKAYLDKKLGGEADKDNIYDHEANMLIELGFKDLQQVDDCIKNYDVENIRRILFDKIDSEKSVSDKAVSQFLLFMSLLIAGMGETFIKRHPWTNPSISDDSDYWIKYWYDLITLLKKSGITVRNYIPTINTNENS